MASTRHCVASLARLNLAAATRPSVASIPQYLAPSLSQQTRHAAGKIQQNKATRVVSPKEKTERRERAKKKRQYKDYRMSNLSKLQQFSLCDAIRYVRAYEVGRDAKSVKYDLAVRVQTARNGAVVRGRIRLPHAVEADTRIGVICKDPSTAAMEARNLGAVAVGEQEVFDMIKEGNMPFNRLICHADSETALQRAGLGRILGPKGLMPSAKTNTISSDIRGLMLDMMGAENYKEREATIRLRVGQLAFTPQMLADNVKAVMAKIKEDIVKLEDIIDKSVHEVVLSSTNSPGFSLSGAFESTDPASDPKHLSGIM